MTNVRNSSYVSVLLSRSDGSFEGPFRYAVGDSPRSLAVGDFNGDGFPDLVTTDWGTVSVLLANGDGTFQPARQYPAARAATCGAVGDMNGDGHLDLAVVTSLEQGSLIVLPGKGDGTFRPIPTYAAGVSPGYGILGDFNGDGIPDVAVTGFLNFDPGTVTILLGKGDSTFGGPQSYSVGMSPRNAAVADVNGDGILDLAVANYDSGTVSILLGKGDGTFWSALNYLAGPGPIWVAVGDFNHDGLPDLAVSIVPGVAVLLNAADWGGGAAPAPRRAEPHGTQRPPLATDMVFALVGASQPQTMPVHIRGLTAVPGSPLQRWLRDFNAEGRSRRETALNSRPIPITRHGRAAVVEQWDDSEIGVVAWGA